MHKETSAALNHNIGFTCQSEHKLAFVLNVYYLVYISLFWACGILGTLPTVGFWLSYIDFITSELVDMVILNLQLLYICRIFFFVQEFLSRHVSIVCLCGGSLSAVQYSLSSLMSSLPATQGAVLGVLWACLVNKSPLVRTATSQLWSLVAG